MNDPPTTLSSQLTKEHYPTLKYSIEGIGRNSRRIDEPFPQKNKHLPAGVPADINDTQSKKTDPLHTLYQEIEMEIPRPQMEVGRGECGGSFANLCFIGLSQSVHFIISLMYWVLLIGLYTYRFHSCGHAAPVQYSYDHSTSV